MSLVDALLGRPVADAVAVLGKCGQSYTVVPYRSPRPDLLAEECRVVRVTEADDGTVELITCAFRTHIADA